MTTLGPGTAAAGVTDWVAALSLPGPEQDEALRALHGLLLRAAHRQVRRMAPGAGIGASMVEELANQAADEALMALLGKLHTFEGRSRFTTWAYKFAVLQAATAVRSLVWQDRDIRLEDLEPTDPDPAPADYVEARDLGTAVRAALHTELTPHQRRVVVALLVEEVPIDVLAERLGTNRNALYKTLHDARKRLRTHLCAAGFLDQLPQQPQAGAR
ncbi:MAG TPA: sigma-70 family RNA polymerase sigma factor [Marmoricola sp.]|nr:sigma-70 family RNA polymerase sigma factor [Marmoricola sp.]